MSALTKAFVVLVTVLSVLLTALVVSTVVRYEDQSQTIAGLQSQRSAAEARASNADAALRNALAREERAVAGLHAQVNTLTGEIANLQTQRENLESEKRQLETDLANERVSLSTLAASDAQKVTLLDRITADLRDLQTRQIENQRQLAQRQDRIADLQGQLIGLERQVRRDRERSVALEEQNLQLEARLARVPPQYRDPADEVADLPRPLGDVTIVGQITAVDEVGPDDVFVQLNVGSADQVARGMEYVVHRDNNYIGTLVVERTDVSASVGRMTLQRDQVRANDRVLAGGTQN